MGVRHDFRNCQSAPRVRWVRHQGRAGLLKHLLRDQTVFSWSTHTAELPKAGESWRELSSRRGCLRAGESWRGLASASESWRELRGGGDSSRGLSSGARTAESCRERLASIWLAPGTRPPNYGPAPGEGLVDAEQIR